MKKLLNTLYVTTPLSYLALDGENIVILLEEKEKFRMPFVNIESIVCFGYMGASPALMGKCAEENIGLCFLSPSGGVLLTDDGRKKILHAWQEKKKEQIKHPVINEKIELGLLPYVQAQLLSRFLRNDTDEYPCFLCR